MFTKMTFAVFAAITLVATTAHAVPVSVERRDMKLATQQLIEKQSITNPAAAGTTQVLSANAGNTSAAAATVTTFVAQPDVPRNLVITPGGTTAQVGNCIVAVSGTNFFGQSITEGFHFGPAQSTAHTGALAFKTVSSIVFPANCESSVFGATWSVGYGEKLGLKRCMDSAGHVLFSTIDGAYESTRPTVVAGSSIAGNTADFNGTMNAASDFEVFFLQNFTCFP